MSTKAALAEDRSIGLTQFSTSIPKGYAMIIRRSDGSSAVFKDEAAELVVAPILSFRASFNLDGVAIPYRCEILPKVVPGIGDKKFPRELSGGLQQKIQRKLQTSGKRLAMEQFDERVITIEVEHENLNYVCLVKLTDGQD